MTYSEVTKLIAVLERIAKALEDKITPPNVIPNQYIPFVPYCTPINQWYYNGGNAQLGTVNGS